jgi:hypothetical protein
MFAIEPAGLILNSLERLFARGAYSMFTPLPYSIMTFAALGPALLLVAAEAPSKNLTPPPVLTLSLDTPVEQIAADPRGKAVLNRDVPGLLANPSYFLFKNMSLSQLAAASGGRLTKAELDLVKADLWRIERRP